MSGFEEIKEENEQISNEDLVYDEKILCKIKSGDAIIKMSKDDKIFGVLLANNAKQYFEMNVEEAMGDLAQVGSLIQISYATSKGFSCNTLILKILSNYQNLIKDSVSASKQFVEESLKAIKYYTIAITMIKKKTPTAAFKVLARCSNIASNLTKEANKVAESAGKLVELSIQGLEEANDNSTTSQQERKEIKKKMHKAAEKQKNLQIVQGELEDSIKQKKREEAKAIREGTAVRNQQFYLNLVRALATPIVNLATNIINPLTTTFKSIVDKTDIKVNESDNKNENVNEIKEQKNKALTEMEQKQNKIETQIEELENQIIEKTMELKKCKDDAVADDIKIDIGGLQQKIENKKNKKNELDKQMKDFISKIDQQLDKKAQRIEDREDKIAQQAFELQKERRKINGDLAQSIEELKNLKINDNNLDAAIKSLEICVVTLGRIKTIFLNTKVFWEDVSTRCKNIVEDTKDMNLLLECEELLLDSVKNTALDWVTLGKMNYTAAMAIIRVDKGVDKIMCNLPTLEQAKVLAKSLSNRMLDEIKNENKEINLQLTTNGKFKDLE